jgi:DNA-binding LacI/PurR family transcriptional regulator
LLQIELKYIQSAMPKRPTLRALEGEKTLLALLTNRNEDSSAPLPTVRQLGEQLDLSYSTVSRLLQRFVVEGQAWQHPNGRYYPAHAGSQAASGLPIVVLGRQIQNWSRLYQEIIEGVSDQCCARGCPLLFLASDKLVSHQSPELPPSFAPREIQAAELQRLASAIPRLCAGLLLDHLWDEDLILAAPLPAVPRVLLARHSCQTGLLSSAPDFTAGARLLLQHITECGCQRIYLGVPFSGDQAVDAAGNALCAEAAKSGHHGVTALDCSTPAKRKTVISRLARLKSRSAIVCTEDNVASLMWQEILGAKIQNSTITLISMQGTGKILLPITRLRYDYCQLGRDVVAAVIERRQSSQVILPSLIRAN